MVRKIIGSGQVSEANRIHALSHDIREVLEDGRQLQGGRRFPQPQPMTRDKGNENQLEVEDQEALFVGVALVNIGSVFDEISESQEVASEGHHELRVFHGNAEPLEGLTNRGEFQAVGA